MPIDGVVADTNVLLSAVVGRAALRVFAEYALPVHATHFNVDELNEYLPLLARKYNLPVETVELQWKLLPIRLHPATDYNHFFPQALEDLQDRDPEDAHTLALSRFLNLPIWSNDRDLTSLQDETYTTAQLLRLLEGHESL